MNICKKCKHGSTIDGEAYCKAPLPYWVTDFLEANSIYNCAEVFSWGAHKDYPDICPKFKQKK